MSLTLLIPMATTLRLQVNNRNKDFVFLCETGKRSLLIQIIILCKQKLSMRNYTQANKSSNANAFFILFRNEKKEGRNTWIIKYCFITIIQNRRTRGICQNHLAFCKSLDLKGRILVAEEGINGTVSGTVENTTAYMKAMKADPRFADTMFKIDPSEGHAFKKMFVRYRPELVSLKLEEDIDPNQVTGAYLSPQEFKEAILDEQTVVIDARNDYEYDLGHFRGLYAQIYAVFESFQTGSASTKKNLWKNG